MIRLIWLSILTGLWFIACDEPQGPQALILAHPCELAENCIYDTATGEGRCAPGYTWANTEDMSDFNYDSVRVLSASMQGLQGLEFRV